MTRMFWRRLKNPAVVLALVAVVFVAAACGGGEGEREDGNALVLRMLYGSEKEAWISDVTQEFNGAGYETGDGRSIQVEAVPMGSGASMDAMLQGGSNVDIWSPASSLYLPLAQDEWQQQNGGELFDQSEAEPLVLSPVVIAMWRPMAESLGWPDEQISWRELADLVASDDTWADYGHPEWGEFKFGHTHPDYSNSGLTTIVGLAHAGSGKTGELSVDDVQSGDTQELVREVEGSVIHYGESTGFFAQTMFERGPSYLSAAMLYESSVIESYDESLHPNMESEVVAIYPEEGSFWSDHPFVVPNTSQMTDARRDAAEQYRSFLMERPQQEKALEYGFRPANVDVPVTAPVDTDHGVDPAQLRTALPIPSVETLQVTREVWEANKKPVDVSVVVDTSGSMLQENRLSEAKEALNEFLSVFDDRDQVSITTFNDSSYELSPLTEVGSKREEVRSDVEGLIADGETRLYDTISEEYGELDAEPTGDSIRAVVVLSDGEDTVSEASLDQLTEQLRSPEGGSSVKVYTIAYGSDSSSGALGDISGTTGGQTYSGSPDTIQSVYADIATFF